MVDARCIRIMRDGPISFRFLHCFLRAATGLHPSQRWQRKHNRMSWQSRQGLFLHLLPDAANFAIEPVGVAWRTVRLYWSKLQHPTRMFTSSPGSDYVVKSAAADIICPAISAEYSIRISLINRSFWSRIALQVSHLSVTFRGQLRGFGDAILDSFPLCRQPPAMLHGFNNRRIFLSVSVDRRAYLTLSAPCEP